MWVWNPSLLCLNSPVLLWTKPKKIMFCEDNLSSVVLSWLQKHSIPVFSQGHFYPFPSAPIWFSSYSDFWSELLKCYNYQGSLDFPAIQAWESQIPHLKVTRLGVKQLSQQCRYPSGKQRSSIPHMHEEPASWSTSLSMQTHYLIWD